MIYYLSPNWKTNIEVYFWKLDSSIHFVYQLTFAHHVLNIDNLQTPVGEKSFGQDLVPAVEALVEVRAELQEE